ncbi:GIY-YIG nuclease family protein [Aestuariivivens sediminis]|uniref:GIY-YIG nuclease family protein n=1 Tax=Aestuariivivens sediminis TaxID=2913557 RepID=UPI001F56D87A|nr:GIY-YIG nuclease family protein [Aestuariivivens sediminis]
MERLGHFEQNKIYYIYALIDPRDNEIFYIGKGKGDRYLQHFKEKNKRVKNPGKHYKIEEIEEEGFTVKTEILFSDLDEKTAYEIERILIYKHGRAVYNEGNLTNRMPGGDPKLIQSSFYYEKIDEVNLCDSLNQDQLKQLSEIKKTSKIIHINDIAPKLDIYRYSFNGELIDKTPIDQFFLKGVLPETGVLLLQNTLPVIEFSSIYSKEPLESIYLNEMFNHVRHAYYDQGFYDKLLDKIKLNEKGVIKLTNDDANHLSAIYADDAFLIMSRAGDLWIERYYLLSYDKEYFQLLEHFGPKKEYNIAKKSNDIHNLFKCYNNLYKKNN